jgi:hypothetical protein
MAVGTGGLYGKATRATVNNRNLEHRGNLEILKFRFIKETKHPNIEF